MGNDAHVPDVVLPLHQIIYLVYCGPSALWRAARWGIGYTPTVKLLGIEQAVSKSATRTRDTEPVHTPWLRIWGVRGVTTMKGLSAVGAQGFLSETKPKFDSIYARDP